MNSRALRWHVSTTDPWHAYQPAAPAGYEMLGVITQGREPPGALARHRATGRLVQLNHGAVRDLPRQAKGESALAFARNGGAAVAPPSDTEA